jgi:hypothetical protein
MRLVSTPAFWVLCAGRMLLVVLFRTRALRSREPSSAVAVCLPWLVTLGTVWLRAMLA